MATRSAILVALLVSAIHAAVTIPDPGTYVVDRAQIVDAATEQQLESLLGELERKTTAQVKVLTVDSTESEPFFDFVQRHAELWKLGAKGKDNGALIAISVGDREVRIHTGYGLEPILPDSWCGTVSRDVFAAHFKRGDFSRGVDEGTLAVASRVADAAGVALTGIRLPQSVRTPGPGVGALCGVGLGPLIILIVVTLSMSRRRRYHQRWGGGLGDAIFWGAMFRGLSGGGRRGGGFGGGFGRGGGGFGGSFGGGGRFGGGGGGARW